MERAHDGDAGAWRLFRRLEDERTAGGQRAADLANRRQRWEVPRREGGGDTDRLLHHHLALVRHAARNDAAIGAAAFLGIPLQDVCAGVHLDARLGQDLALLGGQRGRDRFGVGAHDVGGLLDDARAVVGRRLAPDLVTLGGRFERAVQILHGRVRQAAERGFRRGIDDVLAAAPAAVGPFAVDEERKLLVHPNPFRWLDVEDGRRCRRMAMSLHQRRGGKHPRRIAALNAKY